MEMTDIGQPKRWPGLKLSCFLGQRKKNCKCRKSVSSKKTRMRIGYPKLWHIWKLWHNLFKKTFYCQNGMKSIALSFLRNFEIFVIHTVMPEPGGQRATAPPPIFGRSVNPIPTGEGRLSPPITTWHPQCFSPSSITVHTDGAEIEDNSRHITKGWK